MLIEFSVENFRSIRERQTLSMVASNANKEKSENLLNIELESKKDMRFLKSAILFGPNASGKSNLLRAVKFLRDFVTLSATSKEPNSPTGVEGFKFDGSSQNEVSTFEIIFYNTKAPKEHQIYFNYGFSLDSTRVHSEWLSAFPKKREQVWFERAYNSEKNDYDWKISPKIFDTSTKLEQLTREDNLFLSVAAQFNHPTLKHIYRYLSSLNVLDYTTPNNAAYLKTWNMLESLDGFKTQATQLMKVADFNIYGLKTRKEIIAPEFAPRKMFPYLQRMAELDDPSVVSRKIDLVHEIDGALYDLPFEEESAGTQKFLSLLGPVIDTLITDGVLFIDEVSASMHTLLIKKIIQSIHGLSNSQGQFIMTSHNTTLMSTALFRRDQIWFTERNEKGASQLYPLTDFKPRQEEALEKGYLCGRYGAIPFIPEDLVFSNAQEQ